MNAETYKSLTPKEQAIVDGLILIYKEQQRTNLLLERILKNE